MTLIDNSIKLELDRRLQNVVMRGLQWYKKGLFIMKNVVTSFPDSQKINNEIQSVESVIKQLSRESLRSLPSQTILTQCHEESLTKQILADLQQNPNSVVSASVNDRHWVEARYFLQKGYEMRVNGRLVLEDVDLETITEAFLAESKKTY